jgi:hypothetical protein
VIAIDNAIASPTPRPAIATEHAHKNNMQPTELKIFYDPKDQLRLTVGYDRSYMNIKPVWAAPLSRPDRYLALLDGKGEQIVMIDDPRQLPADSLSAVREELRMRYLTADVQSVLHAKQEFGATYWTVETDRGRRDFVTQNLQENAIWLSPEHLLLLDVDGNRFEIADIRKLNPTSQALIESVL